MKKQRNARLTNLFCVKIHYHQNYNSYSNATYWVLWTMVALAWSFEKTRISAICTCGGLAVSTCGYTHLQSVVPARHVKDVVSNVPGNERLEAFVDISGSLNVAFQSRRPTSEIERRRVQSPYENSVSETKPGQILLTRIGVSRDENQIQNQGESIPINSFLSASEMASTANFEAQ